MRCLLQLDPKFDWSNVSDHLWATRTDRQLSEHLKMSLMSVWRHRPKHIPAPVDKEARSAKYQARVREYIEQINAGNIDTKVLRGVANRFPEISEYLRSIGYKFPSEIKRDSIDAMKQKLIEMARRGEARPHSATELGRMLVRYTNDSQVTYDKVFRETLRRIAPHWWPRL